MLAILQQKSLFFLLTVLALCMGLPGIAQQQATIPGDFPDPTVIRADGRYYAIGTSSEWGPHFPIYVSDDLREWTQTGFVFNEPPEWASSSFWAPEYFYQDGLYYVYYSARRKSDNVSCIGVATSRYPDRGFVDRGIVVAHGSESIDAFVVKEGSELYMTWKAYGLDDRPIELLGSKLSSDGLQLVGEPFSLLMDTAKVGIEGQSFLRHDGYYYLFYSAGNCCGIRCDYHVQAVRSKSIQGPYERIGGDMLLGENAEWKCMGHGTFVKGTTDEPYYLFHGYNKVGTTFTGREGLFAKLTWLSGGVPEFTFIPSEHRQGTRSERYDFLSEAVSQPFWQWDYRHSKPTVQLAAHGLEVGGAVASDNPAGIALTVRPGSVRYEIETTVDLEQSDVEAAKGLVIYGDRHAAIGFSVQYQTLQFWLINEGKRHVLNEVALTDRMGQIELKLAVSPDFQYKAFYKADNRWVEVDAANLPDADFKTIAQWDRSPRPGLHFNGDERVKAVFQRFSFREQ